MWRYDLNFINLGIREHSNIIPKNIIEIGSRDGHDAKSLANSFQLSDSSCYIFEPNPDSATNILRDYPNMNLYNNAVSDISGVANFCIEKENTGASSLLERTEGNKNDIISVDCVRMDEFIESTGLQTIDIAKIDVEGAALNVLKSFGNHLDKLQSLQIELEHKEFWKGQSLYQEVKEWLNAHGYVEIMFVLLRGTQSDSFWLKRDRMVL